MSTTAIVAIFVAIAAIAAVVGWVYWHKRRTEALRAHFGPEYQEALHRHGNQIKAEDALLARQKRMQRVSIRQLQPEERDRFANQWHTVQAEFVDSPVEAIRDANRLVSELMSARGYPMAEFEHRAEDLSVDHPEVVRNYRAAYQIALRREKASTEEMRQGLVHYRDLFDELLEVHSTVSRRQS